MVGRKKMFKIQFLTLKIFYIIGIIILISYVNSMDIFNKRTKLVNKSKSNV